MDETNKSLEDLRVLHPWLKITRTLEEYDVYIEPGYYDSLTRYKDYIFNGLIDLEHLRNFIKEQPLPNAVALELGCGTGRATTVALDELDLASLELVDLSEQMIAKVKERFAEFDFISYINSDSIQFLETEKTYDFIFSLWSLSHAVHQHMIILGLEEGRAKVRAALEKMVRRQMKSGSRFFLIHADSLSEEQKILSPQWQRFFPHVLVDTNEQSPSKQLMDEVFKDLEAEGLISLNAQHYVGEGIVYESLEEALEIFMNFHLGSHFNNIEQVGEILDQMTEYFKPLTNEKGQVTVKTGCLIYQVTRR